MMTESDQDRALRPKNFSEFFGQKSVRENLEVFISSAKARNEPLDHVLLSGPPGLGKTSLSHIIAHEMGSKIVVVNAPAVRTKGELVSVLAGLSPMSILFIDEIHGLNPKIEEILYPAMEDFKLEIMAGNRALTLPLQPFTLIGATTRAGMLQRPLRDRFGIVSEMQPYSVSELAIIIQKSCEKISLRLDENACLELARRSRGTPRIANRLLRRVRDFAQVGFSIEGSIVSEALVIYVCEKLGIDGVGLDVTSRKFLQILSEKGVPVSLNTMVALLGETLDVVEEMIEPYLLSIGFIEKTGRGRIITKSGRQHMERIH